MIRMGKSICHKWVKIPFARKPLFVCDRNQAEQLHELAGRSKFGIFLENRIILFSQRTKFSNEHAPDFSHTIIHSYVK